MFECKPIKGNRPGVYETSKKPLMTVLSYGKVVEKETVDANGIIKKEQIASLHWQGSRQGRQFISTIYNGGAKGLMMGNPQLSDASVFAKRLISESLNHQTGTLAIPLANLVNKIYLEESINPTLKAYLHMEVVSILRATGKTTSPDHLKILQDFDKIDDELKSTLSPSLWLGAPAVELIASKAAVLEKRQLEKSRKEAATKEKVAGFEQRKNIARANGAIVLKDFYLGMSMEDASFAIEKDIPNLSISENPSASGFRKSSNGDIYNNNYNFGVGANEFPKPYYWTGGRNLSWQKADDYDRYYSMRHASNTADNSLLSRLCGRPVRDSSVEIWWPKNITDTLGRSQENNRCTCREIEFVNDNKVNNIYMGSSFIYGEDNRIKITDFKKMLEDNMKIKFNIDSSSDSSYQYVYRDTDKGCMLLLSGSRSTPLSWTYYLAKIYKDSEMDEIKARRQKEEQNALDKASSVFD